MRINTARLIVAATALVLMSTASFAQQAPKIGLPPSAQAQAQPVAPVAPRPVAPAIPSQPTTTTVGRVPAAPNQQAAITMFQQGQAAKGAACQLKGRMYVWNPGHMVGDALPNGGGFYATGSNGTCRQGSLKALLASGAVTINP
jgi:hypothetical protein